MLRSAGRSKPAEVHFKASLVKDLMNFVHSLLKWQAYRSSYASLGIPSCLATCANAPPPPPPAAAAAAAAAVAAGDMRGVLSTGGAVTLGGGGGATALTSEAGAVDTAAAAYGGGNNNPQRGLIMTLERCVEAMIEGVPPYTTGEGDQSMQGELHGEGQHDTDGDAAAGAGEDVGDDDSDGEAMTMVTNNLG
jgi:hypothetical protein